MPLPIIDNKNLPFVDFPWARASSSRSLNGEVCSRLLNLVKCGIIINDCVGYSSTFCCSLGKV